MNGSCQLELSEKIVGQFKMTNRENKMMEVKYCVYYKVGEDDQEPIVFYDGESYLPTRTRRKYAGKKAKIKAIEQLTGNVLNTSLSTGEVNAYIDEHFFGTSQWAEYHRLFKQFANETEVISAKYYLNVSLNRKNIDPDDKRLIYMIKKELENNRLDEFEGLSNPICSVSIHEVIY